MAEDKSSLLTVHAELGDKGSVVEEIQHLLNQWAVSNGVKIGDNTDGTLDPDGIFGEVTKRAVIKFQSANLLLPDGLVGPFTLSLLSNSPVIIDVPRDATPVRQLNTKKCWAAATAYWLRHQPVPSEFDQDQVIEAVRDHARSLGIKPDDAVRSDGALTVKKGQKVWEERFRLTRIVEPAADFFIEKTATRLKHSGRPLILGIAEDKPGHTTLGHMLVIFAAQADFFGTASNFELVLTFMDPLSAKDNFKSKRLRDLLQVSDPSFTKVFFTWVDFEPLLP
jgi:hypothetical protein